MQNDNEILAEVSKLLDQQIEALDRKWDAEETFLYCERSERIIALLYLLRDDTSPEVISGRESGVLRR